MTEAFSCCEAEEAEEAADVAVVSGHVLVGGGNSSSRVV